MIRTRLVLLAFLFSTAVLALAGEYFQHEKGGLGFVVPDGWSAEPEEDSITLSSADESLVVVLWVPEGNTWEAAVEGVFEALESVIQNPTFSNEGEEGELNGMPYYELAGRGKVEGETVDWSVALVQARKPVLVLAFADPSSWTSNQKKLVALIQSMKRT